MGAGERLPLAKGKEAGCEAESDGNRRKPTDQGHESTKIALQS
jgi:hypothetical protein